MGYAKKDLLDALIPLISIAEVVTYEQVLTLRQRYEAGAYRAFRSKIFDRHIHGDGAGVFFDGETASDQVQKLMDIFWRWDDVIHRSLTLENVQDQVIDTIATALSTGIQPSVDTIKDIFRELRKIPEIPWTVFRPLHGATMADGPPLALGPFVIYNWEQHMVDLIERFPSMREYPHKLSSPAADGLVISLEIVARDPHRGR